MIVLTKKKKNDDDRDHNDRGGRGLNVRDEIISDDIGQIIVHIKQNYQKQTAWNPNQTFSQITINTIIIIIFFVVVGMQIDVFVLSQMCYRTWCVCFCFTIILD